MARSRCRRTHLHGLHPLDEHLAHHGGVLTQDAVRQVVRLPVPRHHVRQLGLVHEHDLGPRVRADLVPLHEGGVVVAQGVGAQLQQPGQNVTRDPGLVCQDL